MAITNSIIYSFLEREDPNQDVWEFKTGAAHHKTLLKSLAINQARVGGNWYVMHPNDDIETFSSEEKLKAKYWKDGKYELPKGAEIKSSTVKNHVNSHRNNRQDVNTAQFNKGDRTIAMHLADGKYTYLGLNMPDGKFVAFSAAKPISRLGGKERRGIFSQGQASAITRYLSEQYLNNKLLASLDLEEAKAEAGTQAATTRVVTSVKKPTPPPIEGKKK